LWRDIEGLISQPKLLAKMGVAAQTLAQPQALNKIIDLCMATAWH